ncbi:MAG TPA: hypothetical protein VGF56_17345 [Rhizomicrobium sp.]|jgi:hypothetical protein
MKCFVIQPFDGAVFDKRFEETFDPAIKAAGLEPYRVDRDPGASIPIDAIERGISSARVCFAEISLDNPNVWFELGYAISQRKEICIVCESGRKKFPFDIQHRKIITYDSGTMSDFQKLETQITERLAAIIAKQDQLENLNEQPLREDAGLSHHEVMTLCAIAENMYGTDDTTAIGTLIADMERLGYNRLAVNIGLKRLLIKGMIFSRQLDDRDGDPYAAYSLENSGWDWIFAHQQELNLKAIPQRKRSSNTTYFSRSGTEDEIPF